MDAKEKILILSEKVKELNKIVSELEMMFPEKSFTLDGILVGNIVEVMTAQIYGISLYKQSEKTHDGEIDGKKVQIKGTQGNNYVIIREVPEYLLVEYLDNDTGTIQEIYNGPGAIAWKAAAYVPSMNHYMLRVNRLLELDRQVPEEQRIKPKMPVSKYAKTVVQSERIMATGKGDRKKPGKTLIAGYVNRNDQQCNQ